MKKWLIYAGKSVLRLVGVAAAAIVGALVLGQPLTGIAKLKSLSGFAKLNGLYKIVIVSSVPAWEFALLLMIALSIFLYALKHSPKRRTKGKIHFLRDVYNTGWSKQHAKEMNVRMSGMFTYDGPDELIVLSAFLKGTELPLDFMVQVPAPDGSAKLISTSQLWLREGVPQRALFNLRLTPVLGTPGKPLQKEMIFRDKFNRGFSIGTVEFPYIGK